MRQFTITQSHIRLLRRMNVQWQDCEYGAPEIDPKRPYGNSSVEQDIAEILGRNDLIDDEGCVKDEARPALAKLHRETETALQIGLATGEFAPGVYQADDYRDNWHKIADAV